MNKNVLFFLCSVTFVCHAAERSSSPTHFLDMCTIDNKKGEENQDRRSFCRFPNKGLFFGVMDGHVASDVADYVSSALPNSFYQYQKNLSAQEAFEQTFADAEHYACKNLRGGSTAVFVYINNHIAHIAHAGDSRAIFGGKNGVVFFTQDHKPDRADEHNRITQAGGEIYTVKNIFGRSVGPSRINGLAMSRTIGDKACKVKPDQVIALPEYTQLLLSDAHRWLIIASDGLWDKIQNEEAVKKVQDYYNHNNSLTGVAQLLCRWAGAKNSIDDITVLVIDLLTACAQ